MKTILLSLLLSATTLIVSTTGTFAQKSGDEAAIQKVLDGSRIAFDKRDLTTFSSYFAKSPDLYYQVYEASGQLIMAHGWEAMTHMVGGYMKEHPDVFKGKHTASDFRVHINGNTAWVNANGDVDMAGEKTRSREFFVLEKQSGQWKIAALTAQEYANGKLVVVK